MGVTCMAAQTPDNPITAYFSTGDNQWLLWLPMDSAESVTLAIDTIAKDFHVQRLWWRGGQDDLLYHNAHVRPDNRLYYKGTEWWTQCAGTVNPAAITAAHRNGMKIDVMTGIYEFMCQADAGGCIQFPYQAEDNLRIEHPQWIPVNKYGTRIQGGTLEYGYPEARNAICKRLLNFTKKEGYDGVVFYTYSENYSLRYPDEFGYNDPVVKDFRSKYGVDIRTQDFDRDALAKLRGSYLTELLRELHAGLAEQGRTLTICLDPVNDHQPMIWQSGGKVATAGNIHMDWEAWVKQGLVDELSIFWSGNTETLGRVIEACRGTNVKVSIFQASRDLPAGVGWVFCPNTDVEAGYPLEAEVGFEGRNISKTPAPTAEALKGPDPHARRQWLHLVANGAANATPQQVEAMLHDPDLYVKRGAMRALGKMKAISAIPAIEAMLKDPQNSVRWQAAVVLGELGDPKSIGAIFDAVNDRGTFQFNHWAATPALVELAPKDIEAIVAHLNHPNAEVRRVALNVFQGLRTLEHPRAREALLKMAGDDPDPWNRELAMGGLMRYRGDKQVMAVMEKAMACDADQTVQCRTAVYLSWMVNSSQAHPMFNPSVHETTPQGKLDDPPPFEMADAESPQGKEQRRVLGKLVGFFKQYGDGCARTEKDWGWRAVGNAILSFGPEGRSALQAMIDKPTDRQLADRAWRVVWMPQKVMAFVPATAEEDAVAEAHRPK